MSSVGYRNATPEEVAAYREREQLTAQGGYDHSDVEEAMEDPEVAAAMAMMAQKMGCIPGHAKGKGKSKEEMMKDPEVRAAMAKIQEKMPIGMDLGGKGTFKGGKGSMMDMMAKGKGEGKVKGKGKGMMDNSMGKGKGKGKGMMEQGKGSIQEEDGGDCPLCLGRLVASVVPCKDPSHRFCGNCVARTAVRSVGFACVLCHGPTGDAETRWYACGQMFLQAERAAAGGDVHRASELYTQEFEQCKKLLKIDPDHSHAQFRLSSMLHDGQGVVQDLDKSVEWLVSAATEGHAQAQCNLAGLFQQGEGVEQDARQAFLWCEKSAEQGFMLAQYNLSTMYADGVGTRPNEKQASKWAKKAAVQGSLDAQANFGYRCYNGEGVEQDTKKAVAWLGKAAARGHQESYKAVELIMGSCHNCTKGTASNTCTKCRFTRYCSRECQKIHWKNGHKEQCKIWAAEAAHEEAAGGEAVNGGGL
jgi:hypothetical protein